MSACRQAGVAMALAVASLLPLLPATAQAAPDAAVLNAARAAEPAVIRTLEEMVQIETGSQNVEGLNRLADLLQQRLQAMGARTERLKATRGPGGPIVKASFEGSGQRRLMLIAHMDTVYPAGTLATQPMRRDGNKLYGPGIADDKGGLAVILHALALLKEAGWKDYARLTVLFNPDEEIGSIGSGELIATLADEHDAVLSFEPTAAKAVVKQESLLLGAAGTATAEMVVKGRAAHAGAAPELGRNALIELSHQLLQTRDIAKGVPGAQLNWTGAKAGEVRNQIPESASAYADVRLTAPDAADKLQAALNQQVAQKLVPDTTTTVTLTVGRPPYKASEAGRAMAQHARGIYAELDGRPLALAPMTGGATDAGYAGRSGKAVVLESFGLAGYGYHARDEYIEVDSIVPRLYLASRLLMDLGAGKVALK
ncbi:glutamate carboxypeptidase [Aquabacterium sp.]|uniref:glutamate carboxypeptidase n=1 Tax=Aquabacterium sp. TaxID=1872578 RepID=UPI0037852171